MMRICRDAENIIYLISIAGSLQRHQQILEQLFMLIIAKPEAYDRAAVETLLLVFVNHGNDVVRVYRVLAFLSDKAQVLLYQSQPHCGSGLFKRVFKATKGLHKRHRLKIQPLLKKFDHV
ncbi:hypothetical protein SDC9_199468 [bioreactor metagenome]|uniref:Uncharacterized protein n=1 Tax=bioreactor metagenome TaxID=1076179 RepID=A0A645IMV7_9ZZZZ